MESQDDSDRALVARLQAGEAQAFDALMARYKRPIVNFIYRLIGDAHEADDVAQEVFVRVYRRIGTFDAADGAHRFSNWLFQLARHAAIDHGRRRRARPAEPRDALALGVETAAPHPTAPETLTGRETEAAIARAIAALPEDQRTALVLAVYHEQSYAEIAAVMQCSLKAVEARLYRARQALRAYSKTWFGHGSTRFSDRL